MTAVDTNALVRLLTGDDPAQQTAASALFSSGPIWIPKTVLLETGRVLRSLYGFHDHAIHDAFTRLLGLGNVHAEDEASVAAALRLTAQGIEFVDALHLTSRPDSAIFVSFDRTFVRRAKRPGTANISDVSGQGKRL